MRNNKSGFTLIELLVVVLIIGILAAVALPTYMKAVEKSRATEAITLLKNLVDAEDMYQLANGDYTDDMNALDITMPNISEDGKSYTKNFIISFATFADGVTVRAQRRIGADNAVDDGTKYYLFMRTENGKHALWCSGTYGAVSVPADELGNSVADATCKTIANGNKKGIIYN